MSLRSLTALPATELRRLIGTREDSAVALLDACIARIAALDPAVNAIAATAYDRARLEAAEALKRAFAGIDGLGRPVPDEKALATARPELKSIVTAAPELR